jgi:hypothetical protein
VLVLLEAMAAALDEVDSVAARYRPPVEIPRSGSGRRSGLTSDCIGLLLLRALERSQSCWIEVLTLRNVSTLVTWSAMKSMRSGTISLM